MYDKATGRKFSQPSYVTVSQVTDLTNQVVEVSWRGFTPSSDLAYNPAGTDYPVMVAECKGTHPTQWSQCFGANNSGVAGAFSAYGPMNTAYAATNPDTTGATPIQLLTAEENSFLGCNARHPCSLVIVPSQGGNIFDTPVNCNDHSQDANLTDLGSFAFNSTDGRCSWRDRIVVPLRFARTPTDCPVRSPDFSVIGSPMLARAMNSWQTALCASSVPISIQYDSAQNEPLAREDFANGTDNVALTTLPVSGASSAKPFAYAPVAVSAESVAFWIDNPITGLPLTHLKLDPRLVAKLLTQSYNFENEACSGRAMARRGICDNAVDNEPGSLFADQEFEQLNPHVASVGDGFQIPTVLAGESDMTWELTSWIAANKDAKAFVDGTFDRWGTHVNTDYLNMQIPTSTLTSMDPFSPVAHRYDPVYPLSQVAQYQVDNWYPATDWQQDPQGNYDRLTPEVPGQRALFAILDEADAAAFELPVASLENAAGRYVAPGSSTMAAALSDMSTASNHITRQLNFGNGSKKVRNAYPLTMVIYAMVPTGGISKPKAAKIAQWLEFVANQGQRPGYSPGQLPPGYLPLTNAMRAETLKAASEVRNQTGDPKKQQAHPSASASESASATATPAASPTPTRTQAIVGLGYVANPSSSGPTRYAVPVLLVAAALLTVAGLTLAGGQGTTTAIARLRRRALPKLARFWLPWMKS